MQVSITYDMLITMHAAAFVFKMKVLSLLNKPHDIPNPTQQEHFEISVIGGGIIKVVQVF